MNYCNECDISYANKKLTKYCSECGATLQVQVHSNQNSSSNNQVISSENVLEERNFEEISHQILSDFFHSDLFSSIEFSLNQSRTKTLSRAFLKNLGKTYVDENKSILFDVYIQIQKLQFMAVFADFSWVPSGSTSITANLVQANPQYGEYSLEINEKHDNPENNAVYMKRGKVSFATKVVNAFKFPNLKYVLISQQYDTWPFVMTDSENEISRQNVIISIPIVMISKQDSEHIDNILSSAQSTGVEIQCSLHVGDKCNECSICRDEFIVGAEVLKLSCRHLFHNDCIFQWLSSHSTCPMCRYEMASDNTTSVVSHPVSRDQQNTNGGAQPYFI